VFVRPPSRAWCVLFLGAALSTPRSQAQPPASSASKGAPAGRGQVALTFDDLPVHGSLPPHSSRADIARSLIAALQARQTAPSYGFVNAKGLDGGADTAEVLKLWRAAGYPLGNHGFAHLDINTLTSAEFEQEVLRVEPALREHMGAQDWRWFRFPYLHQGETVEKRRAAAAFLQQKGYRVAEVTLSFGDYAYNDPYARCLAKRDDAALAWLAESYLARAAEALIAGPRQARALFGRDIRHVLLLHIGGFTAAMMPRLLDLIEQSGFDVVSLPEAESDPAYAADTGVASREGLTFLEQVRQARNAAPFAVGDTPLPGGRLAALCQ